VPLARARALAGQALDAAWVELVSAALAVALAPGTALAAVPTASDGGTVKAGMLVARPCGRSGPATVAA